MHHGGSLVAFTYSVPSCVSSAKGGSSSDSSDADTDAGSGRSLPVRVVYPRVAPSLAIPEPLFGEFAGGRGRMGGWAGRRWFGRVIC